MGCIVAECAVVMIDCRMIVHIRHTVRGKQESGDNGRERNNCATAAAKPAGCQMIDRNVDHHVTPTCM
jgi:hypothetical protein